MFKIRDMRPEDLHFIMATMLQGVYHGNPWYKMIKKQAFMNNYKLVVAALIKSPNARVCVACSKEDPDMILGYSILSADTQIIHWVFVKEIYRKIGVARALVPKYPTEVTHLTKVGIDLLNKFDPKPDFNPFQIK